MASNEYVQKYYDSLIASYDLLVDAVAKANDRGIKVSKQLATDVAKGQREALELGRKLAAEPSDLGQFYTAVLEATTAAQGRQAQHLIAHAMPPRIPDRATGRCAPRRRRRTWRCTASADRSTAPREAASSSIRRGRPNSNIRQLLPETSQPLHATRLVRPRTFAPAR